MIPEFNQRNRADGLSLLRWIDDEAAALVVFDPQHRAILERLSYGNEGERQRGRALLPQMTESKIVAMMAEIERVLRPGGHCALWIDKYLLVSGLWHRWMPEFSAMREVDCMIWRKLGAPGMGKRLRYRFEPMVVIQKAPFGTGKLWRDRGFDDVQDAKTDRARHPHAKPVDVMERFIRQVTAPGDLVVDPCAGGYGTLEACRRSGRVFLGGDVNG